MLGRTTLACGHSRSASNIGIADFTRSAGDIAGGGDDAAFAAADDDRLGGKRRIVAFLDRGVEGVAIDMRDGQASRARHGAAIAASRRRRSARFAAKRRQGNRGRSLCSRQAFKAESCSGLPPSAPGPRDLGRIDPGAVGESDQETLVAEHMLQHAGEKAGLAAASRIAPSSMPVTERKRFSRSGSSAMKASA
jgi:hypothetical protein